MRLTLLSEAVYQHIGLFIPLPANLAKQYKFKKEDQSKPHITVLYIGETNSKDIDLISKVSRKIVSRHDPIEVFISGLAWFTSLDGEEVAHSMVEAKGLTSLHKELWDGLLKAGIKVSHSYPEYTPHVTLKYSNRRREYDGLIPEGSWVVKHVELWKSKGNTIARFKLAGK